MHIRIVTASLATLVLSLCFAATVGATSAESASAAHAGCVQTRPDSTSIWTRPFPETYGGYSFALTDTFDGPPACGHTGTDWDLADGGQRTFPVYASDNGWVTHVLTDPEGCYGNYTTISSSAEGIVFAYAHLSKQESAYSAGDPIRKGVLIGYAGSTGTCAAATHLHLSATQNFHGWYTASTVMFSARAFLASHGVTWRSGE